MRWLARWAERLSRAWWALVLAEHDTEPAELSGGLLKVSIGCWLLLPLDTLGSSPTFAALTVLPEWLWGAGLAALGVAHLFALRSGDRDRRRQASTIGWVVWFSFAVTFVVTNPPAFGFLAFLLAGLAQLWCSLRLRRRV